MCTLSVRLEVTDSVCTLCVQSGHSMSAMFADTWKAFTDHTPLRLKDYDGKKVSMPQSFPDQQFLTLYSFSQ